MQIPFYFDYACPWAFFASTRAEAYFARQGVDVDFLPVRLRKLAEPAADGSGGGLAKMGPRKQKNYIADLLRWAAFCGVEIAPNARDHLGVDTAPALRVAMAAREIGGDGEAFRQLHHAIYRARWCEGMDVTQPELLAKLIEAAKLDAAAVQTRAQSDACIEALDRQTAEAIERGVFGVPTLFVGNEMFWGNDRFELVRHSIDAARASS
ncbi:MAG: 2-hydroxychromene-2-carboxylate isomerase [Deltaproteobacteria bacterium]|nr:2-hydroxychromene-2-carboxylate isomerase [Deltaproteobacteria bacterium]MBW2417115.1 2-hydroxychromene-2-carboxylate isomerase [Deltaproteobacteria bacterium]